MTGKEKFRLQSQEIDFDYILKSVPGYVYWKNLDSVYLGCNQNLANLLGLKKTDDIVGLSEYEMPWASIMPETVAHNIEADKLVIDTGEPIITEENLGIKNLDGLEIIVRSEKTRLLDKAGKVIGVFGVSVDITDSKEAERLKIENEAHKAQLNEQERFKKIAEQLAHDIRSPIASLMMLLRSCGELPEPERIALREIAMTIGDIANDLLNKYKNQEPNSEDEARGPVLISALLLQLLTDKKYQYKDKSIKFDHNFTQNGNFAFIKVQATDLKRSISNVINNAVDAMEKKEGEIILNLDANKEWVKITIQDNGKGISPEIIEKIKKNISVTEGKKDGHGIGLTQVRETLQHNQGELSIESALGQGTKITLSFPRITAPSWIAESINLGPEDIVIVLDDDTSIHTAWDSHFESLLKEPQSIKVKHFRIGKEALDFINSLNSQDKEKIFLLTDYELLKQEFNGLHVVEQGKVRRSVLVTSHYANTVVREHAAKTGTKILPKQLASEIPIIVDETIKYNTSTELKKVDLVIVDDDEQYVHYQTEVFFDDWKVDSYTNPEHFLKEASQYPKDTRICLDRNFKDCNMDGIYLAEELNKLGFTKLFLISGGGFEKAKLPKYLIVLGKDNIEKVREY